MRRGAPLGAHEQHLRDAFDDPAFAIPGYTATERVESLVAAIAGLNRGRKTGVYQNLRGTP